MRTIIVLTILAAAVTLGGCSDPLAPQPWPFAFTVPDTVDLYSLGRPDYLGLPGAFDFTASGHRAVVLEQPGAIATWDVGVTGDADRLVLFPPATLPGIRSNAAIAPVPNATFDGLLEAPAAGNGIVYHDSTTVPATVGGVYVVRSRTISGPLGTCSYYAKMEVLAIDLEKGTLRFRFLADPNCNARSFVSP